MMGPERLQKVSSTERLLSVGREIVERKSLQHIAFIVDGNRRWAESRGLPRIEGHRKALMVLFSRVEDSAKMSIPFIACWLFSTENWARGEEEVGRMFDLGVEMAPLFTEYLARLNLRFVHIGRVDRLRQDLLEVIVSLEEATLNNIGPTVLACIDYGGKEEIGQAVTRATKAGVIEFTPEVIQEYLYTAKIPNPDLVIRTSGEYRLSGFMIWQTVHSELYFTKTLFPDFTRSKLIAALQNFDKRTRRFGR